MSKRAEDIVKELTLQEKAGLCSGYDFWQLKSVERLGLSHIMVTDGPHGLRKQVAESDHLGIAKSVNATCFPTAVTTASSWDVDAMYEMGEALAEECLQEQVSVILGPGANIKRSPLCGRNFEYISEDPVLSGDIAAGLINGVQSKGIGTSLKHFAMNNQETRRMTINSVVDKRAQREIYLTSFERAVKKSQPYTVMCSYNKIDDEFASDNKKLLTDILRDEWGFEGLVVSDWGAVNDRVQGVRAGLDLEMPHSRGKNDNKIVKAVQNGELSMEELDKVAIRLVELILKGQENRTYSYKYSVDEHRALARRIASESFVLLKNNDKTLPLANDEKVAVIGEFAKSPRYQGAGSSIIEPHKVDNTLDELDSKGISYVYARGYDKNISTEDKYIDEAVKAASKCDTAIVFVGLTDDYESEGFDRNHLDIPEIHNKLVHEVAKKSKRTIVVLQNGSPITMPWIDEVDAVLEAYLGGETVGSAIAQVLYGDVNPCGKLAETFPIALEDTPSCKNFPGYKMSVEYKESIFVGYRYYEKANKDVLFPFGYGLSYTEYEYSNIKVNNNGNYDVEVTFDVKNIGDRDGKEIVQLYVVNPSSKIYKANKELKGFAKVALKAGEKKNVKIALDMRSFAYYNVNINDWHVESGDYTIAIGAASNDIRLEEKISVKENAKADVPDYSKKAPSYYNLNSEVLDISDDEFEVIYGALPPRDRDESAPFDLSSSIDDISCTVLGRKIKKFGTKAAIGKLSSDNENPENDPMVKMAVNMLGELPLRSFGMFAGDKAPLYLDEFIADWANGKKFKAIGKLFKRK